MSGSAYYWCLHCFRASKAERLAPGPIEPGECPYPDCDGIFWDLIPWEDIRRMTKNGSGLPEIPKTDELYYPEKDGRLVVQEV